MLAFLHLVRRKTVKETSGLFSVLFLYCLTYQWVIIYQKRWHFHTINSNKNFTNFTRLCTSIEQKFGFGPGNDERGNVTSHLQAHLQALCQVIFRTAFPQRNLSANQIYAMRQSEFTTFANHYSYKMADLCKTTVSLRSPCRFL